MTTNVVTVAPDDPIAFVAEVLETRHIKRVPVVDGGKVVGIVSHANLLQALAADLPVQSSPPGRMMRRSTMPLPQKFKRSPFRPR